MLILYTKPSKITRKLFAKVATWNLRREAVDRASASTVGAIADTKQKLFKQHFQRSEEQQYSTSYPERGHRNADKVQNGLTGQTKQQKKAGTTNTTTDNPNEAASSVELRDPDDDGLNDEDVYYDDGLTDEEAAMIAAIATSLFRHDA